MYIGSATNIFVRLNQHYTFRTKSINSALYNRIRERGGIDNFSYCIMTSTINYTTDFVVKYKNEKTLTSEEFNILLAFTQYEVRCIEQAIIAHYKPNLNTNYNVSITGKSGSHINRINNRKYNPIIGISKLTNYIYDFPSIHNPSATLNIRKRLIQTYLNTPYYNYSSTFNEMLKFVDVTQPMKIIHPNSKINMRLYPGINYELIPLNEIWVFNKNLEVIDKYPSIRRAAKRYNIPAHSTVQVNINKRYVHEFLFAYNPRSNLSRNIKVQVTDILTNEIKKYDSIKKAMIALGVNSSMTSARFNTLYIKTGKLYESKKRIEKIELKWKQFHVSPEKYLSRIDSLR